MSDGEYDTVHSNPAGSLPDGELSERLSGTAPPGDTTPEDNAKVSVWPNATAVGKQAKSVAAPDLRQKRNVMSNESCSRCPRR